MTVLAGRQNFYVIVGSSAGALIGLQFVVLSLMSNTPTASLTLTPGTHSRRPRSFISEPRSGSQPFLARHGTRWAHLSTLGDRWTRRGGIHHGRRSAHARTGRVPLPVRGLVVSCCAALRSLLDLGWAAYRHSFAHYEHSPNGLSPIRDLSSFKNSGPVWRARVFCKASAFDPKLG